MLQMVRLSIKQTLKSNRIAIIGAGASGLLSSIILGRAGFKVTVFEKNTKIGRKILATGNGRCNISNENISSNNYYVNDTNFINYPLNQFNYKKFKSFFEELGIELTSKENGRVYPITSQASSVVDILVYEAKAVGVEFILNTAIEKIQFKNSNFIIHSNEIEYLANKVIISTGSFAMPKLGSCNSGYGFAQEFGHEIVEPLASLVQLQSDNKSIREMSGTKIDAKVTLEVNKDYVTSSTADVLFTNYGLSGNAILDVSREASYALSIGSLVTVKLDIFPNINKDTLINKLTKRLSNSKDKDKYFWLEGFMNKKLIRYVIDNSGIKHNISKASQLTKKDIMSLVYFMKNIKINITDTKGFETAEVSAGGVDISQIESKSMQSKLQKGLYFVGEVLDVDGQCGGYNLHWAWASSYVCSNAIKLRPS